MSNQTGQDVLAKFLPKAIEFARKMGYRDVSWGMVPVNPDCPSSEKLVIAAGRGFWIFRETVVLLEADNRDLKNPRSKFEELLRELL